MCAVSVLGLCACNHANAGDKPNGPDKEQTEQYKFQERTIKTDGQTYTDGLISYPSSLWNTPEWEYCSDLDFGGVGEVKGIFYTSPIKYNGKPTKIAAYIGFPQGASQSSKVPALVLVHGGLGTAVPDWVKYWNDLGFAAISIDTEGAEPVAGVSNYNCKHIEQNRYAGDEQYSNGPTNNGFSDYNEDIENQWFYHATSATILACSLISSFDCVDTQKIGVTGISWGGMITNVVAGYDDRFSFAMPVYGALSLTQSCSGFATIYPTGGDQISAKRWDTLEPLKQSNCKVFNVNSINDQAFSFDASSRCSEACTGFVLFKRTFPHGQEYGAYETNLPMFAKYFCGMESEYVEVMQHPTKEDPTLKLRPYGEAKIDKITIRYTSSPLPNKNAQWKGRTVNVVDGVFGYDLTIPAETTYFYVQITYNNNLEVSTYLVKNA